MHTYCGKQLVVMFDKDACIHSGHCVKGLPAVFDINKRPWVSPDAAELQAVMIQIQQCPSGALSYELTQQGPGDSGDSKGDDSV